MSETKKKLSKNDLSLVVRYCVMAVVGVLFCISPALGETSLSVLLGIGFIVVGAIFISVSLLAEKSLLKLNAFIGYFILAFGIFCIKGNVMELVFSYVPYLLITVGAGVILDAILGVAFKKSAKAATVMEFILGAVVLAVGICLLTVDNFKKFASVVLGAVLILTAVYGLILLAKNKRRSAE